MFVQNSRLFTKCGRKVKTKPVVLHTAGRPGRQLDCTTDPVCCCLLQVTTHQQVLLSGVWGLTATVQNVSNWVTATLRIFLKRQQPFEYSNFENSSLQKWCAVSLTLYYQMVRSVADTVLPCGAQCRWHCTTKWCAVSLTLYYQMERSVADTILPNGAQCRWHYSTKWCAV